MRFVAAMYFLPRLAMIVPPVLTDSDAHGPRRPRHLSFGRFEVVGVEVRHLDLGDLGHLSVVQSTYHLFPRGLGALGDAELLADEYGRGRRFQHEAEAPV